jgi:hypothetical protein
MIGLFDLSTILSGWSSGQPEGIPPLKAFRDCILVISDGRLFQSLMVDGKKEFL